MRSILWYTRIGSLMRAHDNSRPEFSPLSHRDLARRAGPLSAGPLHHDLDAILPGRKAREVDGQGPAGHRPALLGDFPPLKPYRGAPAGEPQRLHRVSQPPCADRQHRDHGAHRLPRIEPRDLPKQSDARTRVHHGRTPHVGQRGRERSEEHTSELQSQSNLVCRLLLEKKKNSYPTLRSSDLIVSAYCCALVTDPYVTSATLTTMVEGAQIASARQRQSSLLARDHRTQL